MILVTGATGNVGGQVVRALCARGEMVRAAARTAERLDVPSDVETARVDLDHPDTLDPALDAIHAVFLLGGFATMPELLSRMRAAGVDHVVLLTSRCVIGGRPDNAITGMWLQSEATLRNGGIAWTILRPSGFQSNVLRWLPQLRRGDTVRAPWPDVPIAVIDPADIAAVAAVVLTQPGHAGVAHALSGPEPLTPGEQIAQLADVLRRPLRYQPQSDDEAREDLTATGTAPGVVDAFFRFFSDGEFDDARVVDTVERLTGRPPRTFAQWARAHRHQLDGSGNGQAVPGTTRD